MEAVTIIPPDKGAIEWVNTCRAGPSPFTLKKRYLCENPIHKHHNYNYFTLHILFSSLFLSSSGAMSSPLSSAHLSAKVAIGPKIFKILLGNRF